MNRQRIISFCCALAVLSFSANGLAKSNDLSIKPTIPSSKVKITAPTPAPPVLVAPTKTKAPVSQPAVSTRTPKPTPPKVSVKQPKPSTPKVSVKKPRLSAPKAITAPASLPPSTRRSGLPQAHITKDLGQGVNIRRDLGQTNSIGRKLPGAHSTDAAGLAKGLGGQRTGAGSAMYDRSDSTAPRIVQGSGEHIQGQDKGETWGLSLGGYNYSNVPEDEAAAMIAASESAKGKSAEDQKEIYDDIALTYLEFLDPDSGPDSDGGTAGDDDDKDPNPWNAGTVFGDDDDSDDPPLDLFGEVEERTADSGPGDDSSGGPINPDKIKGIFAGSSGIRFAPGEESEGGGPVNPGQIGEILSNQTQIHTFEGGVPESSNFEDLSKQVQKVIEDGGYSEVQINPGKP